MEGFWKTLLDKISIEIFFMTLCLFGLSLIGLIIFTNQISFIFLIAYGCLSISLSYFLSRFIVFIINKIKKRDNLNHISSNFNKLSDIEKEALLSILVSGDVGKFLHSKHEGCENILITYQFIIAKSKNNWGDYSYIINPIYNNELSALLNGNNKY